MKDKIKDFRNNLSVELGSFRIQKSENNFLEIRQAVGALLNLETAILALEDVLSFLKKVNEKDFLPQTMFWYVKPDGKVQTTYISSADDIGMNANEYALIAMGNAFHSEEEAKEHREEILAKYKALSDKGLFYYERPQQ